MKEQYRCVVDAAGNYKTFVLLDQGGQPQYYQLAAGEQLVDTSPPAVRPHVGAEGLIKPYWSGGAWAEAATTAEIEQWEQEHPAPEPAGPSPIEKLQAENNLLKAQVAASADRQEFLEDCIAEMAMQVYSA